ncbi:MAG: precorrin-3B C(17)-methyltransferase [Deltaproteobacteria bacterium]|nr:precorrin-3B C(17)-methyltransferase [Deltaproteobacteria bacterium]
MSGKLFIVGLGPGGQEHMTLRARQALQESEVVVGYKTYLRHIQELVKDKEVLASGMTKEMDRAWTAIQAARQGRVTALVSGGDPGIYAMAPVVFELLHDKGIVPGPDGLAVEVVPGVPAVAAAGAFLGAPLSHDFACISLSDRLTPWEVIEKRLLAAAGADFVIALYNPKSKGRDWQLGRALEIIAGHRAAQTPVGVVRAAMRADQSVRLCTLATAASAPVDMATILIIGNSNSFTFQDVMVTPRGYLAKYGSPGGEEVGDE